MCNCWICSYDPKKSKWTGPTEGLRGVQMDSEEQHAYTGITVYESGQMIDFLKTQNEVLRKKLEAKERELGLLRKTLNSVRQESGGSKTERLLRSQTLNPSNSSPFGDSRSNSRISIGSGRSPRSKGPLSHQLRTSDGNLQHNRMRGASMTSPTRVPPKTPLPISPRVPPTMPLPSNPKSN